MTRRMLHIFRNTPVGRETLLQSAYFCARQPELRLHVYIPAQPRFQISFQDEDVLVHLDGSYLSYPATARAHAEQIVSTTGAAYEFYSPAERGAQDIPEIHADWTFMAVPRSITEHPNRIGLGHLGPKVRAIVKHAPFPILIPSPCCKPWQSVTTFFGGSPLGATSVRLGLTLAQQAGVPFAIFTQLNGTTRAQCEDTLRDARLYDEFNADDGRWQTYDTGTLEENVYDVPHDGLVILGAAGQTLIRELIFGSKLEKIQAALPNPLLVLGPNVRIVA